jgi:hypothetical protein
MTTMLGANRDATSAVTSEASGSRHGPEENPQAMPKQVKTQSLAVGIDIGGSGITGVAARLTKGELVGEWPSDPAR